MADNYNGFYKVSKSGYSIEDAVFYNPETKETFSKIVWDIDDDRMLFDEKLQQLRFLPLNYDVRRQWLHEAGFIQEGDTVKVVKGRLVPIGTVATVEKIKPYYDRYHRWVADHVYLDNGMRTNVNNCELV